MTPLLPPADLNSREPLLVEIPQGSSLHRIYTAAYEPLFFDKSKLGRFNAPDSSYGVLYTAENKAGAFAEVFLRTPGRTLIDSALMSSKAYVQFTVTRALHLIRLAGLGLARLGATAEVTHGRLPYDGPQEWSLAPCQAPGEC